MWCTETNKQIGSIRLFFRLRDALGQIDSLHLIDVEQFSAKFSIWNELFIRDQHRIPRMNGRLLRLIQWKSDNGDIFIEFN